MGTAANTDLGFGQTEKKNIMKRAIRPQERYSVQISDIFHKFANDVLNVHD